MQAIKIGGSWTRRLPSEALTAWSARAPAGDDGDGGDCDHYNTWTSGSVVFKLCTKCLGDESAPGCQSRHQEALEFWQELNPPDEE